MLHTFVLALVQSITEFLPVSSSGHLILLPFFMNWQQQGLAADIGMHIGTLFAVCVYFYKDILMLIKALLTKRASKKLLLNLIVATIPALVVGFFFASKITAIFRKPFLVAVMLIVFGLFLWLADKYATSKKKMNGMTLKDSLVIGMAQCLSFAPGVSRSGSTMTAARLCGINRSDAAHFSMLLCIPTVAAAGGWILLKGLMAGRADLFNSAFFEGIAFSFLGGLAVIWFLMAFVKKHSFFAFMVYRVLLGGFVILYLWLR